jgi:hypothetical protein
MEISNPISSALDLGESLVERFIPDPSQKRKAKRALEKMEQNGELRRLEARMGAITAEAQSKDKWTSRARPSFMYTVYLILIVNVVLAPAAGIFFPEQMGNYFQYVAQGFEAIPGAVWATFTSGFLGYAGLRSYEKAKGVTK